MEPSTHFKLNTGAEIPAVGLVQALGELNLARYAEQSRSPSRTDIVTEDTTRLGGTKGHSIICTKSNVEIRDHLGIRTRSVPDAFTLFDATFRTDLAEFADAVLDNKPLICLPEDAFEAAEICAALQYSFRKGVPVYFGDNGVPVME